MFEEIQYTIFVYNLINSDFLTFAISTFRPKF